MSLPVETPTEFWMVVMKHRDTSELLWKQAFSMDEAEEIARDETYHEVLGVRRYVEHGDFKAEKKTVEKTIEEQKLVKLCEG